MENLMSDVVEVNAATGEIVERPFTPAEKAQRKVDADAASLAETQAEADRVSREASKAALLARLGITESEAALLAGSL
jgi:hypothetical protein